MTAREDGWFAKAFVNRMWAELVGEGFYEPVDDMGPDRPARLRRRSTTWPANSQHTITTSSGCTAPSWPPSLYARESRPRRNANQTPFAANCTQPLRGDQLFDILLTVAGRGSARHAANRRRRPRV